MSLPSAPSSTQVRAPVACIEVGASGSETILFLPDGVHRSVGVQAPDGLPLLVAVPGLVDGTRVVAASNLGWYDVELADVLGLPGQVDLLRNDAEAAALGEHMLRARANADVETRPDLVFVGLGTGVGGAVVRSGHAYANLFGHQIGFGDRPCRCGQTGCLETVAGGWALPDPLPADALEAIGWAVATAIRSEPLASPRLVVIGGGLVARYPALIDIVADVLPDRTVEPSAAPAGAKSAAAWGLVHAYLNPPLPRSPQ